MPFFFRKSQGNENDLVRVRGLETRNTLSISHGQKSNFQIATDGKNRHTFFLINDGAKYLAAFLGVHLVFIDHYLPGATPVTIPLQAIFRLMLATALSTQSQCYFKGKMDTEQNRLVTVVLYGITLRQCYRHF